MSRNSWKKRIWDACNGVCVVCGRPAEKRNPLTVHHLKPKSRGGRNTVKNCVLWHKKFHQEYHRKHKLKTSDVFGNPV